MDARLELVADEPPDALDPKDGTGELASIFDTKLSESKLRAASIPSGNS